MKIHGGLAVGIVLVVVIGLIMWAADAQQAYSAACRRAGWQPPLFTNWTRILTTPNPDPELERLRRRAVSRQGVAWTAAFIGFLIALFAGWIGG